MCAFRKDYQCLWSYPWIRSFRSASDIPSREKSIEADKVFLKDITALPSRRNVDSFSMSARLVSMGIFRSIKYTCIGDCTEIHRCLKTTLASFALVSKSVKNNSRVFVCKHYWYMACSIKESRLESVQFLILILARRCLLLVKLRRRKLYGTSLDLYTMPTRSRNGLGPRRTWKEWCLTSDSYLIWVDRLPKKITDMEIAEHSLRIVPVLLLPRGLTTMSGTFLEMLLWKLESA